IYVRRRGLARRRPCLYPLWLDDYGLAWRDTRRRRAVGRACRGSSASPGRIGSARLEMTIPKAADVLQRRSRLGIVPSGEMTPMTLSFVEDQAALAPGVAKLAIDPHGIGEKDIAGAAEQERRGKIA